MFHIVEGIRKAWEAGPGALIGFVIGAIIGLCVWGNSHIGANGMLTAPVEQAVLSILVGGVIVGCVLHWIVEAVCGHDNWS